MKIYMKVTTDLAGQKEEFYLNKKRAVSEAKEEARKLLYELAYDHTLVIAFRSWCKNIEGVYVKEVEVIE